MGKVRREDNVVDIISKRSGPRREDLKARALIERNRDTIARLADQLSQGAYSASRNTAARAEPAPRGLIVSDLGSAPGGDRPKPYIRISANRRVVVVDYETGRQMHHLGEVRRMAGQLRFVLATKANGFFSPVDPAIAERLAALDGATIGPDRDEAALAAEITGCLGYE